jgi:hypothetical protein
MLQKLWVILCLLMSMQMYAQSVKEPLFQLTGAYYMSSLPGYRGNFSTGGIDRLSQGALRVDLSSAGSPPAYNTTGSWTVPKARLLNYGMSVKVRSANPSVLQQELRIGFVMNRDNMQVSGYKSKNNLISRTVIDTLRSSANGNTELVYRDSSLRNEYSSSYQNSHIGFDFSWLFRLYPEKRVSLYAGVSCIPGILYDARIESSDYTSYEITHSNFSNWYTTYAPGSNLIESEVISRKGHAGVVMDFMLPIGINIHPFKETVVLKHLHFYVEYRPYIGLMHTKDIGGMTRTGSMLMTGLRMQL